MIGRLLLGDGTLPADVRSVLEAEGLVFMEEGLSGSVRYSHFKAPGRRFHGKVTPERIGIGISTQRVAAYCRSGKAELIDSRLDSPRWRAVAASLREDDELDIRIDYDAMPNAEAAGVSGSITLRIRTPQAALALEALPSSG